MKFVTKLIVAAVTIAATVIGSIWGGFEALDYKMNSKVETGKKEVLSVVYSMKAERNALMKANDEKVAVQFSALNNSIAEIRTDVRTILTLTRRRQVENKAQFAPDKTYTYERKKEVHYEF